MLTPEQLAQIADHATVRKLYDQLQEDIIFDMARRIARMDLASYTTMWQLAKLETVNAEREYIVRRLAEITGKSKKEILAILNTGCSTALKHDDKVYTLAGYDPKPLAECPALQELIWEGYRKTLGTFKNLSKTTANTATRQFEGALDRAYMQVTSGGMSYRQAIKGAVIDLSRNGLAAIQYPSGHTDYIDVAVRRAVLTGVNQTALKVQDARADEFGCDLVEVSAHAGARPTHAEWQGKIYSRSGTSRKYKDFVEATGYGTGDGLGGWNCRHSFSPFFEGLSKPLYSAADLERINGQTVEYNGQRMSLYDATQQQRANERRIRALKRRKAGLEGAGQDVGDVNAKIRQAQAEQRDFCVQTGLKRDYFRERGGKQNQQPSPNPTYSVQAQETLEQTRRRTGAQGQQIIDKPTYNKLTRDFVRHGGIIIRGEAAEKHLQGQGAYASYMMGGNFAFIRDDATVSDVLEEMYHAEQDRRGAFNAFPSNEIIIRREIDAQKHLISVADKYKIPAEELEVTKKNLAMYERKLDEVLDEDG